MKKWRCTVCGQVFEADSPPVPCPVCGAGESAFELVEEAGPSLWRCTVCGKVFEGSHPPVPCPVCGAGEAAFEQVPAEEVHYRNDASEHFVLVGGGIAALEAARAIRKRDATSSIVMVNGEPRPPYNRPALTSVLADGLSFANLVLEEPDFYEENNIDLRSGVRAQSIHSGDKSVELEDGTRIPYTKLLLATGSNPFNPIQAGYDSIPVKILRCYDDALALAQTARQKNVVLVGGGILGLEAAMALRELDCRVTVVELAERLMPIQADSYASCLLQETLQGLGVRVCTGLSVASAGPKGVTLSDGSELEADLVVASLGVRSEVSLAVSLGLELSRGIVVDEFMHTSHPDIWAAGDCAEFGGRVIAMAGAASAMGATAGASMTGDETAPYAPFVPATAFSCPGFSLFSVGAVDEQAEETVVARSRLQSNYKRLFFKRRALSGALFVGENPGAKAVGALDKRVAYTQALELLV